MVGLRDVAVVHHFLVKFGCSIEDGGRQGCIKPEFQGLHACLHEAHGDSERGQSRRGGEWEVGGGD